MSEGLRHTDRKALEEAFVLYVLTDCNLSAPLAWMSRSGRVPHAEVRAYVEQQYLEKPVEELAQYSCANGRIQPKVRTVVEKFFKEWKLAEWVNNVNIDIGTTPSFSNIADELRAGAARDEREEPEDARRPHSTKKWIQRWRRKWEARIGRVPTQLGADITTLSAQAGDIFLGQKTKTGYKNRARFWAQKKGPVLGPCVRFL